MALEITSVGAEVRYAFEDGSAEIDKLTYTLLPDVNEAPEQDMSVETIDVSNISDLVTRYTYGRQDPGGDMVFTLNHTDAVITAWDDLVTQAESNLKLGKRLWFQYWFPNADKSYYWAGMPRKLGTSGISQNEMDTIPAHVVLVDWKGWHTASSKVPTAKAAAKSNLIS